MLNARDAVTKPLTDDLAQFKDHLDMGLGNVYFANFLIRLEPSEVSKVC